MSLWKSGKSKKKPNATRRLRFEQMEDRCLLAIVWANEFSTNTDDPLFDDVYLDNEVVARAIVNRAIDDWNAVITDQDFDNDNNPATNDFQLNVFAKSIGGRGLTNDIGYTTGGTGQTGWTVGVPMEATITMDDNGGGTGWFFDTTPLDDADYIAWSPALGLKLLNS